MSTKPNRPLPRVAALNKKDQGEVSRIQSYFNAIKTLAAGFLQVSSNGALAQGVLYISRPGKLRIEYTPETPLLIIADGRQLFYYDLELKSANVFRIQDTPAYLLLRNKLDFRKDVILTDFERGPGVVRLTLVDPKNADAGSLSLTFSQAPLSLKKWTVTDLQGITTTVALENSRTDLELAPNLFIFDDPEGLYKPFSN